VLNRPPQASPDCAPDCAPDHAPDSTPDSSDPEAARAAHRGFEPRRALVGAAILIAGVALAYGPIYGAGFIWDDDDYLVENAALSEEGGLARIWFEPGATKQYYPMVFTTFWLERQVWGLAPAGYHAVNVLLHGLNAFLLWRVLLALGLPAAFLAAAVFALHPVEVESVGWVTERKNLLSGFFYFASLLLYWRFSRAGASATGIDDSSLGPRSWWVYGASLACFVAALLSKTVACSLPAVILLLLWWKQAWWKQAWWKHGRVSPRAAASLVPFFAVGIALGLNTAWMERDSVGAVGVYWDHGFVERCLIAGRALWFYAGKLIWPHPLIFQYERWAIDSAAAWQYLYPLAAGALVAALWFGRHRVGRGPLVAVLIFAGTLLPALGFIDVYPMRFSFVADHFQYLASCALIALAVCGGAGALEHRGIRGARIGGFVALPVLMLLGLLTWQQARVYQDAETLWRDVVRKNPRSALAQHALGRSALQRGDKLAATLHYAMAVQADPLSSRIRTDYALSLEVSSRREEAIEQFEVVLGQAPEDRHYPEMALVAGIHAAPLLIDRGDVGAAIAALERALAVRTEATDRPDLEARAHALMAEALAATGDGAGSERHWDLAVDGAWRAATLGGRSGKRGRAALDVAASACRHTNFERIGYLEVLAAAHLNVGQLDELVLQGRRAVDLARARGFEDRAAEIESRIRLYVERYGSGDRPPFEADIGHPLDW